MHWFRLRDACGACGTRLERGEQDYFLGGMLFNLVLSELLFAAVFVTVLVLLWPTVPWDGIAIGAPLGMALAHPISKAAGVAMECMLRKRWLGKVFPEAPRLKELEVSHEVGKPSDQQ